MSWRKRPRSSRGTSFRIFFMMFHGLTAHYPDPDFDGRFRRFIDSLSPEQTVALIDWFERGQRSGRSSWNEPLDAAIARKWEASFWPDGVSDAS